MLCQRSQNMLIPIFPLMCSRILNIAMCKTNLVHVCMECPVLCKQVIIEATIKSQFNFMRRLDQALHMQVDVCIVKIWYSIFQVVSRPECARMCPDGSEEFG